MLCALWLLAAIGVFGLAAAVVVGRAIDEMGGDDDHTHPQQTKGQ